MKMSFLMNVRNYHIFRLLFTLIFCTLFASQLIAQFVEIPIDILPAGWGDHVLGDYDNDGDIDILTTGIYVDGLSERVTRLYRNDGAYSFTSMNSGICDLYFSSADWGDYDNDGDLDLLIAGAINGDYINGITSRIYKNEGNSVFTDVNANLFGVAFCRVRWGDIDNDGDIDAVLAGANRVHAGTNSENLAFYIYSNMGNGSFQFIESDINGTLQCDFDLGDFDSDGDLDIVSTGVVGSNQLATKVYRNDGMFQFVELPTSIPGVNYGSILWCDYDNDCDLDILITSGNYKQVWRYDGEGVFINTNALQNTPTNPTYNLQSLVAGDYDNDGDTDFFVEDKIYKNEGNDTFTEISTNILRGRKAFADFDGDGDLDLLAGNILYRNDTNILNTAPLPPQNIVVNMLRGSINLQWDASTDDHTPSNSISYNLRIGTIDNPNLLVASMSEGDGHLLVPTLGNTGAGLSHIIKNLPPNQNFIASVQAIDQSYITSPFSASVSFISPIVSVPEPTVNIYPEDGAMLVVSGHITLRWTRTESSTGDFAEGYLLYLGSGSAGFNIENGLDLGDVTSFEITQNHIHGHSEYFWKIVPYNSAGQALGCPTWSFTIDSDWVEVGENLIELGSGALDWGDFDNDGDLDLGMIGSDSNWEPRLVIYRNDGNEGFYAVQHGIPGLMGNMRGSFKWGDYDNDGDLDFLMTGMNSQWEPRLTICRNNSSTFQVVDNYMQGIQSGNVEWGDLDNDGDLDIFVTGSYPESSTQYVTKIYIYEGNDVFSDSCIQLRTGLNTHADLGDYNNDGDIDIIQCGRFYEDGSPYPISQMILYDNNGNLNFTETVTNTIGISCEAIRMCDLDNDGDLDFIGTGYNSQGRTIFAYRNDVSSFSEVIVMEQSVCYGDIDLGDYDNDGDMDVLLSGNGMLPPYEVTMIIENSGGFNFVPHTTSIRTLPSTSSISWGDYDGDGDLDIAGMGGEPLMPCISSIYRNDIMVSNQAPTQPTIDYSFSGSITLHAANSSDDTTPPNALHYNYRIGSYSGESDFVSPMSLDSGQRLVCSYGNSYSGKYILNDIAPGNTIYASAQALDNSYSGSSFSQETIIVTPDLELVYPNGGELLHTGDLSFISWNDNSVNEMFLDISPDNGITWQPVSTTPVPSSPGTFEYTVPEIVSSRCLAKISWTKDTTYFDTSDSGFSISNHTVPYAEISQSSIQFGNVWTNHVATKIFDITNTGLQPLDVSLLLGSGAFSVSTTSMGRSITQETIRSITDIDIQRSETVLTIPAMSTRTIFVSFLPTSVMGYNRNLFIETNAPNLPSVIIPLSGTGYNLFADFTTNPEQGDVPLTVEFTNQSVAGISSCLWEFGDGESSNEMNPSHTFYVEGVYNVTLTVWDQYFSTSITRPVTVIAHPLISSEQMTGQVFDKTYLDELSPLFTIHLQNTGTDTLLVTNVYWQSQRSSFFHFAFDGINEPIVPGATTDVQIHFTPLSEGVFADTLCIVNNSENHPLLMIPFSGRGYTLHAGFTADPTSGDVPLTVSFTDSSTEDIIQWGWNFGDGNTSTEQNPVHEFDTEGEYSVELTVSDGTHFDTISQNIVVIAHPLLSSDQLAGHQFSKTYLNEIYSPFEITLNSTGSDTLLVSNIYWKSRHRDSYFHYSFEHLNDPILPGGHLNISVSFAPLIEGVFADTLCVVNNSENLPLLEIPFSGRGYLLHAIFSTNPETGDVPLTVTFADQSTEDIIQWNWDFMDGNTSTLQNPVHTFQVEGVYPVTLTVSDGVHFDSVSHNITVIAHPLLEWNEEPSFNFGVVYLSDVSPKYTISIYNSGTDSLYIEDIRWKDSRQEFHFNCDILNQPILPGNYGSVNVWFEPIVQGNFSDSLFIETNAENIPFINVKFSGVGEYVPPLPPENVSISMNGHHAIISWNTVNQNIYGFPFSPDYYIVSYNGSSDPENGQYYFLALTPELTLTHPNVGLHADNMFYRVRAYKYYGRGVNEIAKLLRPGMPEEEALNILSSFE